MGKKSFGLVIVVMSLISGVTGSFLTRNELANQITALEAQVTNLQTNLGGNLTVINELEAQATDLQTSLDGNLTVITELEVQATNLQTDLDGNLTVITGLEATINTLQGDLDANVTRVAQLEATVAELQTQVDVEILGVYFSPNGECESQVIEWIGRANSSIHILIYSFTLDSVSDALITAHDEGVEVRAVFEKSQITQYSEYQKLKTAGVSVRNDTNSKLMHHKVMIVDEKIVLTGSFNWSTSGQENNNENLIVIKSTYIADIYEDEFQEIWLNSI